MSEKQGHREAVEGLARDLYQESQKVDRSDSSKRPATWDEAHARARAAVLRNEQREERR